MVTEDLARGLRACWGRDPAVCSVCAQVHDERDHAPALALSTKTCYAAAYEQTTWTRIRSAARTSGLRLLVELRQRTVIFVRKGEAVEDYIARLNQNWGQVVAARQVFKDKGAEGV